MIKITHADLKGKGEKTFIRVNFLEKVETRLTNQYWFQSRAAYEANEVWFEPGTEPLTDEKVINNYKSWLFKQMQDKHSIVYHELAQLAFAEQQDMMIEVIVDEKYSIHGEALINAIKYFAKTIRPWRKDVLKAIETDIDNNTQVQYGHEEQPMDRMWLPKYDDMTPFDLPRHRLIKIKVGKRLTHGIMIAPQECLITNGIKPGEIIQMGERIEPTFDYYGNFSFEYEQEGDWTFVSKDEPNDHLHDRQLAEQINILSNEFWPEPNVTFEPEDMTNSFEKLFDWTTGGDKYTIEDEQSLMVTELHHDDPWEADYTGMMKRGYETDADETNMPPITTLFAAKNTRLNKRSKHQLTGQIVTRRELHQNMIESIHTPTKKYRHSGRPKADAPTFCQIAKAALSTQADAPKRHCRFVGSLNQLAL